jgi:hypothetical protein
MVGRTTPTTKQRWDGLSGLAPPDLSWPRRRMRPRAGRCGFVDIRSRARSWSRYASGKAASTISRRPTTPRLCRPLTCPGGAPTCAVERRPTGTYASRTSRSKIGWYGEMVRVRPPSGRNAGIERVVRCWTLMTRARLGTDKPSRVRRVAPPTGVPAASPSLDQPTTRHAAALF